ncbi:MAG: hypothetical protein JO012_22395 [Hyphomicrobiales bacterium]|nr:hypothetical protein [Hyphomicrobiales bacterium]
MLVTLFINLLKQELKKRDDRRLWEQGAQTGGLFDAVRDARNDVVHTFFDCDPVSGAEGHFRRAPRKGRSGQAEIRTVAMGKSDIDELCSAISQCFESIDDLILKLWFRHRFLSRNPSAPADAYERAVHGWQDPPCDVARLTLYPKKRAIRAEALRGGRPNSAGPKVGHRREIPGRFPSPQKAPRPSARGPAARAARPSLPEKKDWTSNGARSFAPERAFGGGRN